MNAEYLNLRRDIIESEFTHLNPMQRQAVLTTEGPLLLLAGAGSGKTTVLINRIANLILFGQGADAADDFLPAIDDAELAFLRLYRDNLHNAALREAGAERARQLCAIEPVKPWQILAITFTNKAADELKTRLEKRLGDAAQDIWAMTFHAACVRILRRFIDRLGYRRSFTIYDSADSQSLVKRILKDLDLDEKSHPPRHVLSDISRAKDKLLDAASYLNAATGDFRREKTGEIYLEYEKRLREADALDFDDLLLLTVRLLQEHDEVREHYQRQFHYVLIDEYQDTNHLQYLFSNLLAAGHGNICVVGDDDQSIYKFRGATIQNILDFEKQHPGARTIRLEQNYRSTANILAAASAVIRNNEERKGKELWTKQELGEKLTHYIARNQDDEANYVAQTILADYGSGGKWGNHAVLYRMNALSNQLEYAFQRGGIPYRVVGGIRFFDRAEVKDITAYLAITANPADDLRTARILNVPPRGIGPTSAERLQQHALERGLSLHDTIQISRDIPDLQRAAVRLAQFANLLHDLRRVSESMPLDQFYDFLLDATGYLRMLEEKPLENEARIANVWELKNTIVRYQEQNPDGTLAGFLDEIALYTGTDDLDRDADAVSLMTIHSAKGLEFPNVYLVGMEDGIFPGSRSIGDVAEMEEERRLCYVAITRAEKKLHLISANQRMVFGRTQPALPSRFLEEIPAKHIEQIGQTMQNFDLDSDPNFSYNSYKSPPSSPLSSPARPPYSASRKSAKRATVPLPDFHVGDCVMHLAFGKGEIHSLQKAGNDALIEIEFEENGTKRLMLRTAATNMTKC